MLAALSPIRSACQGVRGIWMATLQGTRHPADRPSAGSRRSKRTLRASIFRRTVSNVLGEPGTSLVSLSTSGRSAPSSTPTGCYAVAPVSRVWPDRVIVGDQRHLWSCSVNRWPSDGEQGSPVKTARRCYRRLRVTWPATGQQVSDGIEQDTRRLTFC